MNVNEWFSVNIGLRLVCVLFPWLFNVYLDCVVGKVCECLGKGKNCSFANSCRFKIYLLLCADDIELVADSEEKLC